MTNGQLVIFAPSPSEPGGAQRRTRLLAEALTQRGWSVLIVGRTTGGFRVSVRQRGGVTVLEAPGFGRRRLGAVCFLACALLVGIALSLRTRAYVAIQLSSPAIAAGVCGLITRRPFVVMSSTSGSLSETSLLVRPVTGPLRRRLLQRAVAIVGQTEEAADELSAVFGGRPRAVIPNPVASLIAPAFSGEPRVSFAGRLSEEKDLPLLLSAWESLAADRPHARLTLIGTGGQYRSVEAQLRRHVEERPVLRSSVEFTGWLPDPKGEIAKSDVFVLPSLSEGMSNSLLEACALGRVAVASDIPPNRAILGDDYPLLFSAGDCAALQSALRVALDDETVRAQARAAVSRRIHLFSPDRVAEALERLLDANRARNK